MLATQWQTIALGLGAGAGTCLVLMLLIHHACKRVSFSFHVRLGALIACFIGGVAIILLASPSTFEQPLLAGVKIALFAVGGAQLGTLVSEARQRDVA